MSSIPHLREVIEAGVSLSVCDLFNVTFSTTADQALFDRSQAKLACRQKNKGSQKHRNCIFRKISSRSLPSNKRMD
ncbi:hypothetical protein RB195_017572 [Necator americanus]|uniref:Uncharacterized protein n=1 Tax=Necator americanus TaxID=51031 RepID=A0ABR1C868_NECAM